MTCCLVFLVCCKPKKADESILPAPSAPESKVDFAKGFSLHNEGEITVLEVSSPWPNSAGRYKYALVPKEQLAGVTFAKDAFDAIIPTPVQTLVATSTTHIPALDALNVLDKLVGFPDTKYISSLTARKRIADGLTKDLGQNETLNTEMTLDLKPDVVVGFAINGESKNFEILRRANIPVVFNGDWVEQTPLGKAEWIKFFGVLLGMEKEADSIFNSIKTSYLEVKTLASKVKTKPSVLSGALYKDVWYLPAGESWGAQFLEDAGAEYRFADSKGTGSLSLSIESVLEKGQSAEFWVSPSQYTSYSEMNEASTHYSQFEAFSNQKVFTFANTKGPTGGLLYYELAPQRPDLVLKDLVKIFHPELLPGYDPFFFKPLK